MNSYEKRQNEYDRFFDKGLEKLDKFEDKIESMDIHPSKKLEKYDELIQMAFDFYRECQNKEIMDCDLFPNSESAYKTWDFYQKQKQFLLDHYDDELAGWNEEQELKKEEQARKRMITQYKKKILALITAPTKKSDITKNFPKEHAAFITKAIKQLEKNGEIRLYKENSHIILEPCREDLK